MTEEKQEQDNLLRPKSGTATSSPHTVTASQTDKIFATLWFMKKEAYAESTAQAVGRRLKHLAKRCALDNAEVVKGCIAEKDCSAAFKESLVEAYDLYCRANGIVWGKPFYQRYDRMPKIPSEEKLNMIIADASKKFALMLSMMRDLGTRPIELTWLKLKDIDSDSLCLRFNWNPCWIFSRKGIDLVLSLFFLQ